MTKKKDVVEETLNDAPAPMEPAIVPVSQDYARQTALEIALQHHKINGGMLTGAVAFTFTASGCEIR